MDRTIQGVKLRGLRDQIQSEAALASLSARLYSADRQKAQDG